MKVEIKETKRFTPIEINLTIESKEELIELWHRLNLSNDDVNKLGNSDYPKIEGDCTYGLFIEVDDLLERL